MENAKVAASEYLLTMLLQKTEAENPGTIAEMIEGVNNDRSSATPDGKDAEHVAAIFQESLTLLKRAAA